MIAPDYAFYASEYGGTLIPEEQFAPCIRSAARTLDADTMGRASGAVQRDTGFADAVMQCCCALAECEYRGSTGADAPVQSETLGSWSRTYVRTGAVSPRAARRSIEEKFLAGSGLLYRGR